MSTEPATVELDRTVPLPYTGHKSHYIYTSDDIKELYDVDSGIYQLTEAVSSSGMSLKYRLTEDELGWLDFVRGHYQIAEYIGDNMEDDVLTIDCVMEMSKALDDDCKGAGKAIMLSDDTSLQTLLFWLYTDQE